MDRRGRISVVNVILFLGLVAGGILAYTFAPYYWDYMKMKEITKTTVLEWAAWDSRDRAQSKLETELDRREISDYILADDCQLIEEPVKIYTAACAWKVDVYYPFTDKFKTLSFETLETVDEKGLVH